MSDISNTLDEGYDNPDSPSYSPSQSPPQPTEIVLEEKQSPTLEDGGIGVPVPEIEFEDTLEPALRISIMRDRLNFMRDTWVKCYSFPRDVDKGNYHFDLYMIYFLKVLRADESLDKEDSIR